MLTLSLSLLKLFLHMSSTGALVDQHSHMFYDASPCIQHLRSQTIHLIHLDGHKPYLKHWHVERLFVDQLRNALLDDLLAEKRRICPTVRCRTSFCGTASTLHVLVKMFEEDSHKFSRSQQPVQLTTQPSNCVGIDIWRAVKLDPLMLYPIIVILNVLQDEERNPHLPTRVNSSP